MGQELRQKFFSKPHFPYFLLKKREKKERENEKGVFWYPSLKEVSNSREEVLREDAPFYVILCIKMCFAKQN